MTQEEIGKKVSLTAARVGQILKEENLPSMHWRPITRCLNCNKEEIRSKYFNNKKFCSMVCYKEYTHKNSHIDVVCLECDKIFEKRISDVLTYACRAKHGATGRDFCSKQCFGKYIGKRHGFGSKKGGENNGL